MESISNLAHVLAVFCISAILFTIMLALFWRIVINTTIVLLCIVAFLKFTGQETQHVKDGLTSVSSATSYVIHDATTSAPMPNPYLNSNSR
jgi:hypothetical protein